MLVDLAQAMTSTATGIPGPWLSSLSCRMNLQSSSCLVKRADTAMFDTNDACPPECPKQGVLDRLHIQPGGELGYFQQLNFKIKLFQDTLPAECLCSTAGTPCAAPWIWGCLEKPQGSFLLFHLSRGFGAWGVYNAWAPRDAQPCFC